MFRNKRLLKRCRGIHSNLYRSLFIFTCGRGWIRTSMKCDALAYTLTLFICFFFSAANDGNNIATIDNQNASCSKSGQTHYVYQFRHPPVCCRLLHVLNKIRLSILIQQSLFRPAANALVIKFLLLHSLYI